MLMGLKCCAFVSHLETKFARATAIVRTMEGHIMRVTGGPWFVKIMNDKIVFVKEPKVLNASHAVS